MVWDKLEVAKWAVKKRIMDNGESWGLIKLDSNKMLLHYKDKNYKFFVRLILSKRTSKATLKKYVLYTCLLITHFDFQTSNSARYISEHHQYNIALNRQIPLRQIRENEAIYYRRGGVTSKQALRAKEYILRKLDDNEHESFVLIPTYLEVLKAIDSWTYIAYKLHLQTQAFQACFITLGLIRRSFSNLRYFYRVDRTYTRSKYRIILTITITLDSNNQVLLVCQGVIPRENEYQWLQYYNRIA